MHGICLQRAVYRGSPVAHELMPSFACLQCWMMEQASISLDKKRVQEDAERKTNPRAHPHRK